MGQASGGKAIDACHRSARSGQTEQRQVDACEALPAAQMYLCLAQTHEVADADLVVMAAVTNKATAAPRSRLCPLQGAHQCQLDIIRSIVCTDLGFIVTVSYCRAMYIYAEDHMDKPKRVLKASAARFSGLAWDKANNWLLTGAADGCVKVWSLEGRILDELMHSSDQASLLTSLLLWSFGYCLQGLCGCSGRLELHPVDQVYATTCTG